MNQASVGGTFTSGAILLHGVLFTVRRVDPTEQPNEYGAHFHFLDLKQWKRTTSADRTDGDPTHGATALP